MEIRLILALGLVAASLVLAGCGESEPEAPVGGDSGGERVGSGPSNRPGGPTAASDAQPTKVDRGETRKRVKRPEPGSRPYGYLIPDRPGYARNPFTDNIVDVRGLQPGTMVKDPADSDRAYVFRVPPAPEGEDGS